MSNKTIMVQSNPEAKSDVPKSTERVNQGKLTFEEVVTEEMQFIQERRLAVHQEVRVEGAQVEPECNAMNAFGLCLSGGGIRSAAFNLGVLQALAKQKLLVNLDYLSTVSGGGYIGSWLMAWIHRDGDIANVEKLLVPERQLNATAQRTAIDKPLTDGGQAVKIFPSEPDPIRHLRANTNYLAPVPGILSVDSWALLAIYLRNVFLNALVLVPTLIAIKLVIFAMSLGYRNADQLNLLPLCFGIVLLAAVLIQIGYFLRQARRRNTEGNYFSNSFGLPISLFVLACYGFGVHSNRTDKWMSSLLSRMFGESYAPRESGFDWGFAFVFAGVFAFLHTIPNIQSYGAMLGIQRKLPREKRIESPWRWILSGAVAGFALGFLSLVSVYLVSIGFTGDDPVSSNLRLTLIVPLFLLSFFIAESLQVGILGRLEMRAVREKWSYFAAYSFLAAVIWFVAFLHVCILPKWCSEFVGRSYRGFGPTLLWLVTSALSLWLAHSQESGGKKKPYLDIFIKAGPIIVLSGLMLGVAMMLQFDQGWANDFGLVSLAILAALSISLLASLFVDVNVFSLQELYQDRLVGAFLGASRLHKPQTGAPFRSKLPLRHPDPITRIDPKDDIELRDMAWYADSHKTASDSQPISNGPLHLINAAINLGASVEFERQERQADGFTFSSLHCGCARTQYRSTLAGYGNNMTLGTAFAISGAAVSPNMGYYSTPAVTALLTFFNLRLGAWMPNPAGTQWRTSGPRMGWVHLMRETMGMTNSKSNYIYLSDGGHFDNLGAFELIRRRCKYIVASDAGADPTGACHEMAMVVRKAFIDFGVRIQIDLGDLAIDPATGFSKQRVAVGKIIYPPRRLGDDCEVGYFIYLKMSMDGSEPPDIHSYKGRNASFPHQSTIDQFYSESQFESYRNLGYEVASRFFRSESAVDEMRSSIELQKYLDNLVSSFSRRRSGANYPFESAAGNVDIAAIV